MTEQDTPQTARRRARRTGGGNGTPRRRRVGGAELVETLNEMVGQLIKENRRLKRQIDKLSSAGAVAGGAAEKTLRSLHRKVQRAVGGVTSTTRRRSTSTASATRRRRTASPSTRRSSRRRTAAASE